MTDAVIDVKTCSKCGQEKSLDCFRKKYKNQDKRASQCKVCADLQRKKWAQANPEKVRANRARWRKNHPEKDRLCSGRWRRNNPEKARARDAQWQRENPEKCCVMRNKYRRKRMQQDIHYRLRCRIAVRILQALKSAAKQSSTTGLLGCSIVYLNTWLELQFQDGMTWENHGPKGWHIDHIKPCKEFDLTCPKQQQQCFHYTNLQPLWAKDNLVKGDKWNR